MKNSSGIRLAVLAMALLTALPLQAGELKLFHKIDVHGFASQGFLNSAHNNVFMHSRGGSFAFAEAGVNFGMNLGENVRVGAQIFARDLGNLGDFKPGLDWAFIDWRAKDYLGVRAGRFKLPQGLYNETADVDALRTSIFQPQSVYALQTRDLRIAVDGIDFYGNIKLGKIGGVSYQGFGGWSRLTPDGSMTAVMDGSSNFAYYGAKNRFSPGMQVLWNTPLEGLRLGVSLFSLNPDLYVRVSPMLQRFGMPPKMTMAGKDNLYKVYSAEYTISNWMFAAEWTQSKGNYVTVMGARPQFKQGWYFQGSRRLNKYLEVGGYYSVVKNLDKTIKIPHMQYQRDFAYSLRIDITRNWIFKLEGHDVNGAAEIVPLSLNSTRGSVKDWQYYAAKLNFAF